MVVVEPVVNDQSLQEFELGYYVICCSRRLAALDPPHSDTHVRAVYHVHVVGAVANR